MFQGNKSPKPSIHQLQGWRRLASTRLIAAGPGVVPPKEYEEVIGHSYQMGLRVYASARPERLQSVLSLLETAN